jgi:DtxR family transcriptional regulator, Mn-dependent transcriptional regulator
MTPERTLEDYIKAVYKLQRTDGKVTTSALATELRLADASVTGMIQKLSRRGYLRYVPYQGVDLTERGRRMALKIVRRHRLWEMFLVHFLKYPWEKVHDEAERLEHATSDELEERLDAALGWPGADPHGDPIPTSDGSIHVRNDIPLSACAPGTSVRIRRVSDHDRELLEHAAQVGLTLNRKLTVKEKRGFDGSMLVQVGSQRKYISAQVANAIFVQPIS